MRDGAAAGWAALCYPTTKTIAAREQQGTRTSTQQPNLRKCCPSADTHIMTTRYTDTGFTCESAPTHTAATSVTLALPQPSLQEKKQNKALFSE